jgi:hypothetical protein
MFREVQLVPGQYNSSDCMPPSTIIGRKANSCRLALVRKLIVSQEGVPWLRTKFMQGKSVNTAPIRLLSTYASHVMTCVDCE